MRLVAVIPRIPPYYLDAGDHSPFVWEGMFAVTHISISLLKQFNFR
jgi:hypothetical protein